jgi:anti-sigma factor RsiW
VNCEDFEKLLADAWGDELTAADKAEFEAHLARCEACRREYETGRQALDALRSLSAPREVEIERRGPTLILHDPTAPPRRRRRLFGGHLFRYAASILIAFAAGYALHSGMMLAELGRSDAIIALQDDKPQDEYTGAEPASPAENRSLQNALLTAHQRNPKRTNLAKCMIAMFPANG